MSSVLRIARIWPFAALLLAGCAEHLERPAALPATCASPAGAGGLGLGCANRANLAAMVADPADLQRGRELTPASGLRAARVIEAYEAPQQPHDDVRTETTR